jgi:hypothetical protein
MYTRSNFFSAVTQMRKNKPNIFKKLMDITVIAAFPVSVKEDQRISLTFLYVIMLNIHKASCVRGSRRC